ncbi:MAG: hypothetical protein Ta2F_15150 [Termitinemataceae bacterium]|nr:MAG: hypothetical protein Ta2F_15150 [Termitinemataceae bacterium]
MGKKVKCFCPEYRALTYRATVPQEPEKSGFSFAGWHLQDSVASPEFTSSTVVKSNMIVYASADDGDKIVSAKWTGKTYTVHFMVGEGGSEHASASVTYPQNTVTLPATMPTKENCYNDGFWYNGEDRFTNQTIVTGNTNVYPKWITAIMALTSLSAKYGSLSANLNQISNTAYTCSLPSFVESVVVQAIGEGPQGSTVTFDPPDKTISSWGIGDNKTVTITIHSGLDSTTKVYTVTFEKRSEVETQMASGGTVTFLKNGTGTIATWDELHTFTTNGTLAFDEAVNITNARALIVGGGGGSGVSANGGSSGGGGGGGFIDQAIPLSGSSSFPVVVGSGGAAGWAAVAVPDDRRGKNGSNSSVAGVTAYGGGGGSYVFAGNGGTGRNGASGGGGAGGGAAAYGSQGTNGASSNSKDYSAGGGGGAGSAGTAADDHHRGGAGGKGKQSDILGNAGTTWYAGGGSAGYGQNGATGTAINGATASGATVTPNTGAGASGVYSTAAAVNDGANGKAGASGIVIVRFQYSE